MFLFNWLFGLNYSSRKLFMGLADAAFTVLEPTVIKAIKQAVKPAPKKNKGLKLTCEA